MQWPARLAALVQGRTVRRMTDGQARQYVIDNPAEFGCTHLIREDVEGDRAQVLHGPHGFAIVRPLGPKVIRLTTARAAATNYEPVLSYLWVDPDHRGQGHGQRLIREVLRQHGQNSDVVAACHGPDRLRMFRRCGFGVDATEGEWHHLRRRCDSLLAAMLRGW